MDIRSVNNPIHFRKTIVKYINKHVKNDIYSTNIEKSIYNYSVLKSKKEKIVKEWENVHFVLILVDFLLSIKIFSSGLHRDISSL